MFRYRALCFVGVIALLPALPAQARDILLNPPIDCDLGTTCHIQAYVDTDPSPAGADFTCGPLANDTHKGTDFALPSRAMMRAGVSVLAAAPGTVARLRDGMPDVDITAPDAPDLEGRDCGNAVVVDHGGGWETQYCHLKQGSVAVRQGDRVAKGSVLGQVGLSGRTTFPHVHLSVRHNGAVVDPFNPDGLVQCAARPARSLWQHDLPYVGGGIVSSGFASAVPSFDAIKEGGAAHSSLPEDAPALVIWSYVFGPRTGDVIALSIEGPQGEVLTRRIRFEKSQPRAFRAIGRKLPTGGWPQGSYSGTATFIRDGDRLDEQQITLNIGG